MTEHESVDDRQKWEQEKARGWLRYVGRHSGAGWVLVTAAVVDLLTIWPGAESEVPLHELLLPWLIVAIFVLLGVFRAMWEWRRSDKKYAQSP